MIIIHQPFGWSEDYSAENVSSDHIGIDGKSQNYLWWKYFSTIPCWWVNWIIHLRKWSRFYLLKTGGDNNSPGHKSSPRMPNKVILNALMQNLTGKVYFYKSLYDWVLPGINAYSFKVNVTKIKERVYLPKLFQQISSFCFLNLLVRVKLGYTPNCMVLGYLEVPKSLWWGAG